MKNQNTANNATEKKASTMRVIKRATKVLLFNDATQRTEFVNVVSENKTQYTTDSNEKLAKKDTLANISKNRYAVHDSKKSYLSHVDLFSDVHALADYVRQTYDNTTDTQYFVINKEHAFKMRIQKDSIEVMSEKLEKYENAFECSNAKDFNKYHYCVQCRTIEQLDAVMKAL